MHDDGFLSERADPLSANWVFDVPWLLANGHNRRYHEFYSRAPDRAGRCIAPLERDIAAKNLLTAVLYGNPAIEPGQMCGMSTLYNTLDPEVALAANVTLDGGARDSDASSAWLIGFGRRTVYMVSADGEPPQYAGDFAIVLQDWRYAVRIANIGAETMNLRELLDKAAFFIPSRGGGIRPIFWLNSHVREMLRTAGIEKDEFRGVPLRTINELRSDEAIVL